MFRCSFKCMSFTLFLFFPVQYASRVPSAPHCNASPVDWTGCCAACLVKHYRLNFVCVCCCIKNTIQVYCNSDCFIKFVKFHIESSVRKSFNFSEQLTWCSKCVSCSSCVRCAISHVKWNISFLFQSFPPLTTHPLFMSMIHTMNVKLWWDTIQRVTY